MQLITDASEDKLRGGFYSPMELATFILRWVFAKKRNRNMLEPSCGDGVFIRAMKQNRWSFSSMTAIELDEKEAAKAMAINLPKCTVLNQDFLKYCLTTNDRYDTIVGNPPFIRYQFINKAQQEAARLIFERSGLKYSKLTNTWVSFVVGASQLLTDDGILGMVIPAELLQVGYAKVLREYLAKTFNKVSFISFKKLVFPDIQQEVILLFCEKNKSKQHLIGHIELNDENDLNNFVLSDFDSLYNEMDFESSKWTTYFLNKEEIDFLNSIRNRVGIKQIRDYAKVEVGMTTGSNPYFTVSSAIVNEYNLQPYAKRLVGRSVQVPSAIFTEEDWASNNTQDIRSNILLFPTMKEIKSKGVLSYLQKGIDEKINEGYKCGIRDEWQIIPSAWIPDALFIRRNNLFPKLIINEARAYTTDTMHRVSVKEDVDIKAFVASYYNSISLAFSEICGRSHGGGVLELMPNEVEDIPLPYNADNGNLINVIDSMLRAKKPISDILNYTNGIILKEHYNINDKEITMANAIWEKLQKRRLGRGGKE